MTTLDIVKPSDKLFLTDVSKSAFRYKSKLLLNMSQRQ